MSTSLGERSDSSVFGKQIARQLRAHGVSVLLLAARRDNDSVNLWLLGCECPSDEYPDVDDYGQRNCPSTPQNDDARVSWAKSTTLSKDSSPWVVPSGGWHGIQFTDGTAGLKWSGVAERFEQLDTRLMDESRRYVPEQLGSVQARERFRDAE